MRKPGEAPLSQRGVWGDLVKRIGNLIKGGIRIFNLNSFI
jgi:hypothetical protein